MGPEIIVILIIIAVIILVAGSIIYYMYSTITESKIRADLKYAFHQTDHRFNRNFIYRLTSIIKSYVPFILKVFMLIAAVIFAYDMLRR